MLCSNSLFHGDERELDFEQQQIKEERQNEEGEECEEDS